MRIGLLLLFTFLLSLSFAQPTASFTQSSPTACVGQTVTLTSTSIPNGSPIVYYIWSAQGAVVEAAEGSGLTSFSFVYNNPGTYNLVLTVRDQNGLTATSFISNAIQVFDNPVAQTQVSSLTCNAPFQLHFGSSGSTTGANIQYQWTFPGGNPATFSGTQTNVSYANEGVTSATLRVTNSSSSCFDEAIIPLNLVNFLADFQSPTVFCKGSSVQLFDLSSAGTNQWNWSVTNGTINNPFLRNPTVTFNQVGTQVITLTAINSNAGCNNQIQKIIQVVDIPNVSYVPNNTFGCAPKTISFTNTSGNTSGSTFIWDFDDGSTPFVGVTPPAHIYANNNIMYFPKLTVTNVNGCKNSFIGDTIYLFRPEANFIANPPLGCAPANVQFTNQSYSPEPITSWKWDFDDGSTSIQQNPTHVFPCGTFDVRLIVQTQSGCIDTTYMSDGVLNNSGTGITTVPDLTTLFAGNDSLTILRFHSDYTSNDFAYPTIRYGGMFSTDFTYSPSVLCSNEPLTLIATGVPPCPPDNDISYKWGFEGFEENVTFDPSNVKFFYDTLKFSNPMDLSLEINFRGCISPTTIKTDRVYLKGPVSKFVTSGLFCNVGPGPHSIAVNDLNSIYGHSGDYTFEGNQVVEDQNDDDVSLVYFWGDGDTTIFTDDTQVEDSDKGATNHVYNGYGTYTIQQLIINHTTGCRDSSFQSVYVTFVDTEILLDSICSYTDYKVPVGAQTPSEHFPIQYNLTSGSQNFSNIGAENDNLPNSPFNLYFIENTTGFVTLNLTTTNGLGCSQTVNKQVRVLELPQAVITLEDDTICKNSNVSFTAINSIFGDFNSSWSMANWTINNQNSPPVVVDDTLTNFVTNQLNLKLFVTDGFGCKSLNADLATVYTQGPQANFTYNPYLCNNVEELLNGSSSTGNGLSYQWYFDGNSLPNSNNDSLLNTIIVSPDDLLSNNYVYSLAVTDNKGCMDSLSKTVLVSNPRILSVSKEITATHVDANGNFTCPPVVVDFDLSYQSTYPINDYRWSLGNDLDTDFDSYNENPNGIQYIQAGNYNLYVELVETVTGCVFTYIENPFLTIGGPQAEILITTDTNAICGMSYIFQLINPSDNLHHWIWDLGDGTFENSTDNPDNSFIHTYLDVSDFEPVIIIYDDSSQCAIPITMQIDAFENGLNAFFEIVPDEPVVDLDMLFHDLSTNDNDTEIISWIWDFGDGDSLIHNSGQDVNHIYLNDTIQWVTLTIRDEFGCTDQYKLPIDIFKVNFNIPNILTQVGSNGVNSYFTLFEDIFHNFELTIVNRWGNVVYTGVRDANNPLYLWNGIGQNGDACSDGVYYYKIEGLLLNGKIIKHQDFLTLVGGKN